MMNKFSTQINFIATIERPFLVKVLGIMLIANFAFNSLEGQEFAPIGAKWHYTHGGGLVVVNRTDYNLVEVIGDTIIGEKKCSILEKRLLGCTLRPLKEYIYEEDGRVFYFNKFYKTFNLLYDFNLIHGDTLFMVGSAGYSNTDDKIDTLLFKVDSISFVEINGINLKQQHISSLPSFNSHYFFGDDGIIIEKLGHNKKMFPWDFSVCDGSVDLGLRCYEDSEIGHYETGIAESCIFTGLEEIEKNEIKIFPNPVQNDLVIHFKQQPSKTEDILIKIFDITGKLVLQTGFQKNINVANLQQGVYLLHLFDLEHRQLSYKFLKL